MNSFWYNIQTFGWNLEGYRV